MKKFLVVCFFVVVVFQNYALCGDADTVLRKITEISREASCYYYEIQDREGKKIPLPAEIESAMECPVMLSLSPDYNNLMYVYNNSVRMYNFSTGETEEITEIGDYALGYSNALWSPDGTKVIFALLDNRNPNFPGGIYVVEVENGRFISRTHHMVKVRYTCGSICTSYPGHDFWFISNSVIGFNTYLDTPDEEGEISAQIDLNNSVKEILGK